MSVRLDEFLRDWFAAPVIRWDGERVQAGVHSGITMFRDGPFMVQQWTCPANSEIGAHSHPHLDGYAVRIDGNIVFTVDGRIARPRGLFYGGKKRPVVAVPAGAEHSAVIGPVGAVFLAITEWLDGAPTSVHLDWQGTPLDARHAAELGRA